MKKLLTIVAAVAVTLTLGLGVTKLNTVEKADPPMGGIVDPSL